MDFVIPLLLALPRSLSLSRVCNGRKVCVVYTYNFFLLFVSFHCDLIHPLIPILSFVLSIRGGDPCITVIAKDYSYILGLVGDDYKVIWIFVLCIELYCFDARSFYCNTDCLPKVNRYTTSELKSRCGQTTISTYFVLHKWLPPPPKNPV